MKFARLAIAAALLATPGILSTAAQAKAPKWSCVALDPLNPMTYTCFIVNRP
jgi:hypothetical protein